MDVNKCSFNSNALSCEHSKPPKLQAAGCVSPLFRSVERKRLHLLYCLLNSLYEQINVLNLGYKTLNSGKV